jgi:predicted ArsR family transcriptional regulator
MTLMRRIEKLAKAGKVLLAKSALQEGHIQFLHKINNEGEARRSTRAIVLGTAKVMSWEDLEEAKAKRAEQKEKEVRKITRAAGGKHKKKPPKAHDSLVEVGGERTSKGSHTTNNDADQLAEPHCIFDGPLAPGPENAPVARMW